jgi:hypothetical protein
MKGSEHPTENVTDFSSMMAYYACISRSVQGRGGLGDGFGISRSDIPSGAMARVGWGLPDRGHTTCTGLLFGHESEWECWGCRIDPNPISLNSGCGRRRRNSEHKRNSVHKHKSAHRRKSEHRREPDPISFNEH